MSTLTPEQSDGTHAIFGVRYLKIQADPNALSRGQRRAQGERKRSHGIGTRAVSAKHLLEQQAVYENWR